MERAGCFCVGQHKVRWSLPLAIKIGHEYVIDGKMSGVLALIKKASFVSAMNICGGKFCLHYLGDTPMTDECLSNEPEKTFMRAARPEWEDYLCIGGRGFARRGVNAERVFIMMPEPEAIAAMMTRLGSNND